MTRHGLVASLAAVVGLAAPISAGQAASAPSLEPGLEARYAATARAAGLACNLAPVLLRASSAEQDIVEFRCATADDGRIGIFKKGAAPGATVYNCVTVKFALSLGCVETKEAAAYPAILAELKRLNIRNNCRPDGVRVMGLGANRQSAYLEVGCEGLDVNGQILQYDLRTLRAIALTDCATAQRSSTPCGLSGAVVRLDTVPDQSMNAQLGSAASQLGGFVRQDTGIGGVIAR